MARQRRPAPLRRGGPAPTSRHSGAPEAIVGRRFARERVVVSGGRFERCAFVACELVCDGRPVHLVGNVFEGCTWSFEGAAGGTLALLALLCREDPGLRAELAEALDLAGAWPDRD